MEHVHSVLYDVSCQRSLDTMGEMSVGALVSGAVRQDV